MRRILVDHARRHRAAKRPGVALQVPLDDGMQHVEPRSCEPIDLDQALTELMVIAPRQGQIVEMRYFGLSDEAVAVSVTVAEVTA